MAADEMRLPQHLADELVFQESHSNRTGLYGPFGSGSKCFVVRLPDVIRSIIFAENAAEAEKTFKAHHGVTGSIHKINVVEHK